MMALTTQLWTINALATELGISSRVLGRRLSDLAPDDVEQQDGRQVKRWRLARALKHLKAADRTIVGPCGATADSERARLVRAKARRAELEADALERSLLPFDEVVAAWEQLVAAFRARCLAIPSRLAPRLAMTETTVIRAALTAEIREALIELSRYELPRDRPGRTRGEPPAGSNGKSRGGRARVIPVH
jgi:hypothetical protein